MAETIDRKTIREDVARSLGLLMEGVAGARTGLNADQVDIVKLADLTADAERMRDAYVFHPNATNETNWRRILRYGYPGNTTVDVSRDFDPVPTAADSLQVYFMLDLDDWNACTNRFLKNNYFIDRATVTLVENQLEYALTTAGTQWVTSKGQVYSVRYRLTTSGQEAENEVPNYTLVEDSGVITVKLHRVPPNPSTYQLIVAARRNFTALDADAETTVCPWPLLEAGVRYQVLTRIFSKFGTNIKRLYGPDLMQAEKDLADARAKWLPPITAREYVQDEEWWGPDVDAVFDFPAW